MIGRRVASSLEQLANSLPLCLPFDYKIRYRDSRHIVTANFQASAIYRARGLSRIGSVCQISLILERPFIGDRLSKDCNCDAPECGILKVLGKGGNGDYVDECPHTVRQVIAATCFHLTILYERCVLACSIDMNFNPNQDDR